MDAAAAKTLLPYDFLTVKQKAKVDRRKKERNTIEKDSEGKFLIESENSGVPHLTMAEWGVAASRIGYKLLKDKTIDVEGYVLYNAYCASIFSFAEHFEWQSVLRYDITYRENQAISGFAWGTRNSYMEAQELIRFDPTKRDLRKGNQRQQNRYVSYSSPNNFCRQFAAGHCNFGDKCRYSHIIPSPNINNDSKNEMTAPQGPTA